MLYHLYFLTESCRKRLCLLPLFIFPLPLDPFFAFELVYKCAAFFFFFQLFVTFDRCCSSNEVWSCCSRVFKATSDFFGVNPRIWVAQTLPISWNIYFRRSGGFSEFFFLRKNEFSESTTTITCLFPMEKSERDCWHQCRKRQCEWPTIRWTALTCG